MADMSTDKESIVKTLLTSTTLNLASKMALSSSYTPISKTNTPTVQYVIPPNYGRSKTVEDLGTKMHNFYNQFSGSVEKDQGVIAMDHSYARPLNWTPESAFFQPTKTLFMPPLSTNKRKATNPLAPSSASRDLNEIDVESVTMPVPELYDRGKAMQLMNECERHVMFGKANQDTEDWEESISRLNWTPAQNRLFSGVVAILNSNRLARLAYSNVHHEPILRRTAIEKSVKRLRQLLATVSWDCRLTQWMHQLLIDHLSAPYLAAYFDILQSLKAKLPTFVDKMMYGPSSNNRVGITSNESLFHLLKRPWDPYTSHLQQNKPRKLPGNPVLIIVPSAPNSSNANQFKRQHKWLNLLSNLSTVVAVHTNIGNTANRLTMMNCAEQMLAATRAKIQEVKTDFPARPIILVGFNAGAALALQVAQVEHILCVVCLGFSLLTAEGKRGDPDDSLLELQSPVLFVIGQCSNTSLQEDLEDLRERMRVENGLIVVGSADDYLRVSKKKKREEGITQSAVDRIIVENVGEFISGLLLSPYPPQMRQSPTHVSSDVSASKRVKIERKRNNSNGSSIDSEPPSPTPKITRPAANIHALGLNRSVLTSGSTLSNLLQNGGRPSVSHSQTQKQGGIKVLENLTLNSGCSTAKLISSTTGRAIDLSKITVLNSVPPSSKGTVGNVVLMPDGKIKSLGSSGKGTGTTPLLLPMSTKNKMPNIQATSSSSAHRVAKYITSKKQLIGRRPPHPLHKPSIVSSYSSNLPPPTNLTSQDIMDLPIIFADDNQMLTDNSKLQQSDIRVPEIVQPTQSQKLPQSSNPVGKFVFINKQTPAQSASNTSNAPMLKRPTASIPIRTTNPVKYTKIIISRASTSDPRPVTSNAFSQITNLSSEISIRKIEPASQTSAPMEVMDLEKAIAASTIPKAIPKQEYELKNENSGKTSILLSKDLGKRTADETGLTKEQDSDPDYLPPKRTKIIS